tara:strand:+ start:697 stop:894 length:198 start_codon:yes stop_codon:yes gene_type:complete
MSKRQRKALDRSRGIRKASNIRRNNLPHNTPIKDKDGNNMKDDNGKVLMERNPLKGTVVRLGMTR